MSNDMLSEVETVYGVLQLTSKCRIGAEQRGVPFLPFCPTASTTRYDNNDFRDGGIDRRQNDEPTSSAAFSSRLPRLRIDCKPRVLQKYGSNDVWAKVVRSRIESCDGCFGAWQLSEVIGPVRDRSTECEVYLRAFGATPCVYPAFLMRRTFEPEVTNRMHEMHEMHEMATELYAADTFVEDAITIDGEGTRDRDDALSYRELDENTAEIGVHVVDAAYLLAFLAVQRRSSKKNALDETLGELAGWCRDRAASFYFTKHGKKGSVPMLPSDVSHDYLSLDARSFTARSRLRQGFSSFAFHPCVSVFFEVDTSVPEVVKRVKGPVLSRVRVVKNDTYDGCRHMLQSQTSRETHGYLLTLLSTIARVSGCEAEDVEGMVEWSAVKYNTAITGHVLSMAGSDANDESAMIGAALVRVPVDNEEEETARFLPQRYAFVTDVASVANVSPLFGYYGHFSSPIRRFADLYNQFVAFGAKRFAVENSPSSNVPEIVAKSAFSFDVTDSSINNGRLLLLDRLNARTREIKLYHLTDAMSELAYSCFDFGPRKLSRDAVSIETSDDGRILRLRLGKFSSFRVPVYDSYYAEEMCAALLPGFRFPEGIDHVYLHGVFPRYRAELRLKFEGIRKPRDDTDTDDMCVRDDITKMPPVVVPDEHVVPQSYQDDEAPPSKNICISVDKVGKRRMHELLGYPLDAFQSEALDAMVAGEDVLGMAPTGSGKTALALTAIVLCAFDCGKRAVLTTPMKALSNQKFAEFRGWLDRLIPGGGARLTLLTGDIQARATMPGGDGGPELLIMTSEILANKLDTAAASAIGSSSNGGERGIETSAADTAHASCILAADPCARYTDPDLKDVSIVVMDEVHYINDPSRGHVWERAIMRLPPETQLVALSATLNDPEGFRDWMALRRPTRLVQRHDRHVPLYLGVYGKIGDKKHVAAMVFHELYCTTRPERGYDARLHDAVLFPPRQSTGQSTGQGTGQGIGQCTSRSAAGRWQSDVDDLVNALDRDGRLPAIVFTMSRANCVKAAQCVSRDLLLGPRPRKPAPRGASGCTDLLEETAYQAALHEHETASQELRRKQGAMFSRYLAPFFRGLEGGARGDSVAEAHSYVPGFEDLKALLDRGVGFHHAGMLPVLREYVELLFQARLLRVVFATETLAVGINMPAKTAVLTQAHKPTGTPGSSRALRTDEFWQMAGRSGRRGMDDKGYVVYFPCSFDDALTGSQMRDVVLGPLPAVRSRLRVTPAFVLRQYLAAGHRTGDSDGESNLLRRSLLYRDSVKLHADITRRLTMTRVTQEPDAPCGTRVSVPPPSIGEDAEEQARDALARHAKLTEALAGKCVDFGSSITVKLTPKQRKQYAQEIRALESWLAASGGKEAIEKRVKETGERERDEQRAASALREIPGAWHAGKLWLQRAGYLTDDPWPLPTLLGKATSALSTDALPFVRAKCVVEGWLDDADATELLPWLACFTEPLRIRRDATEEISERRMKENGIRTRLLDRAYERCRQLRDELAGAHAVHEQENAVYEGGETRQDPFLRTLSSARDDLAPLGGEDGNGTFDTVTGDVTRLWITSGDLREVCKYVEPDQIGGFVRCILRVLSLAEETCTMLLGLGKYELHARLAERHALLLSGVVTNKSLYVCSVR